MCNLYGEYVAYTQKIADLQYADAVLNWDQEINLPPKGIAARSRQMATLSEIAQEWLTDPKYGDLLERLAETSDLTPVQRKNVAVSMEDYRRQLKRTPAFVRGLSETVSAAYHAWIAARRQNDFKVYEAALDKLIGLKIKESELIGYEDNPYDALLSEFEKNASVLMLDGLFETMTPPLKDLLTQMQDLPVTGTHFLHGSYPRQEQMEWGEYLVRQMGLDMQAARLDISEHPFTTNFSARDVRITTRINEYDVSSNTWSCIHEAGHALYEQGLPDADYGLPSGMYASLSIHESQSRFWENCVGRGEAFWQYYFPKMQERFPAQLRDIGYGQFFKAINVVQPSLIRTEADELTYHFHIKVRYQIEKELICRQIGTKDIPQRWRELYRDNLGVAVPDDRQGSLQDIHWAIGSFGYFPTYSLGSFYAAQFWMQMLHDVPDVQQEIATGNLAIVLEWLRENIHRHGRQYSSEELCRKVTGKGLDAAEFVRYLTQKLGKTFLDGQNCVY